MVRTQQAATARRQWPIAFGAAVALLGLTLVGSLPCQAQMSYRGGLVPTRPESRAATQSAASTKPPIPPSFFPDNDWYYPTFSEGNGKPSSSPPISTLSYYLSPTSLPWNQAGFVAYEDPLHLPQDGTLTSPKKYDLQATSLSPPSSAVRPESALLIAHLPEHAVFWVEGVRTQSTGRTRYFESPPLQPGQSYRYTMRVAWIEDGRWVSQTRMLPVRAGIAEAIYLQLR
jgi:uncharacterized protein (TIGR03000 family)